MMLEKGKLEYYKSDSQKDMNGIINMDFFKVILKPVQNDQLCFNLTLFENDRIF